MYAAVPTQVPSAVTAPTTVAASPAASAAVEPVRALRETEVEQLDAGARQHHVGRLEVAMDNALAMRGLQRISDLRADPQDVRDRNRTLRGAGRQRLAVQQLHHEVRRAVDVADIEQRADARMRQARNGPGLALETSRDWAVVVVSVRRILTATRRSSRVSFAR